MRLKNTIGSVAEEAAQRAGETASSTADWARSASGEAAARARRGARTAAHTAYEQGDRAVGLLARCVEEHPVTSVLTAFGLGIMTASLLRLRD